MMRNVELYFQTNQRVLVARTVIFCALCFISFFSRTGLIITWIFGANAHKLMFGVGKFLQNKNGSGHQTSQNFQSGHNEQIDII